MKRNCLCARPDLARLVVRIHVLGVEDIGGQRREATAIWSGEAPILSAKKLEFSLVEIAEKVPHAESVRVTRDERVDGLTTQKVTLEIAEYLSPWTVESTRKPRREFWALKLASERCPAAESPKGIPPKFVPMPLPTFVVRPNRVASTKPKGVRRALPMGIESGEDWVSERRWVGAADGMGLAPASPARIRSSSSCCLAIDF